MQISWHGEYTIRIQTKNKVIVLDPHASFRGKADIVALTNPADKAMSAVSKGDSMIIDTPGEYSIDGLTLHALAWRADDGSERSLQRWIIEDMVVVHLGKREYELTDAELAHLEQVGVDILFVPVGKGASDMVTTIEPRVVIPIGGSTKEIAEFGKEMGVSTKPVDKLTIKANKLPQDETEIVILQS